MKRTLYFGLRLPARLQGCAEHCPLIEIQPIPYEPINLENFTHYIVTSQTTLEVLPHLPIKPVISVGSRTTESCLRHGQTNVQTAFPETAEGLISLLQDSNLSAAHIFYPHSALSRPLIQQYLLQSCISHVATPVYTTNARTLSTPPDLAAFDELIFTSPSTVDAFLLNYGHPPPVHKSIPIGPVTAKKLNAIN